MKIPAIDEGETVEVLPSLTRSLAVCVTLEDKHGSWVSWFSPPTPESLPLSLRALLTRFDEHASEKMCSHEPPPPVTVVCSAALSGETQTQSPH